MLNMNYATLIHKILNIAVKQKGVNSSGEGDIYAINEMPDTKYAVFWVSSTTNHVEYQNYMQYNLTFYYIDREQYSNNEKFNADSTLICSNGIQIISNIIAKLRFDDDILDIDENINYTLFNDTEVFADKCAGVYVNVGIKVPKDNVCPVD